MGTTLTISRGDSRTFTIPATLDGVSYDLGDVAVAIFTAKHDARDLDSAAAIQKASGLGLSTSGSNFTLSLVPADTDSFFDGKSLAWDIQGQLSDGKVLTLASGTLRIVGDITRETTTSVPVYTSEPPIPGNTLQAATQDEAEDGTETALRSWSPLRIAQAIAALAASVGASAWGSITGTLSDQSDLSAALAAKQPLDSDLTAIAALSTTSFGRSLLELANAAAARTALGAGTSNFDGAFNSLTGRPTTLAGYGITDAQPVDSDLTAIAALTTTSYGRNLLTLVDAAAALAAIGAAPALLTRNTQTTAYTLVAGDAGKVVELNVGTAANLTVPAGTFSDGQVVVVRAIGAGQVTLVGSGVTLNSRGGALKLYGQYSEATIAFRSASEANVSGDLTT